MLCLIIFSCSKQAIAPVQIPAPNPNIVKIAFGSCSEQNDPQLLWDDILKEAPDLWIWLGDNIYGDSPDMDVMRSQYVKQKSHPLYQQLMASTTIIGTWDDHDYGINNGGKHYPHKKGAQKELLDFLDVPQNDPRRHQEGVYASYDLDHKIAKVKVYLLDTRYFRDDPIETDNGYLPNNEGSILGEAQWAWLKEELKNSNADVNIFASGIQVIPEEHRYEKWSNFPKERNRLFDLIQSYNTKAPVFISGDRHIGEISKITSKNQVFYDLTSSSLTHGWKTRREEANKHRVGDIVYDINYGIITITNKNDIKAYIKGDNQKVEVDTVLSF